MSPTWRAMFGPRHICDQDQSNRFPRSQARLAICSTLGSKAAIASHPTTQNQRDLPYKYQCIPTHQV